MRPDDTADSRCGACVEGVALSCHDIFLELLVQLFATQLVATLPLICAWHSGIISSNGVSHRDPDFSCPESSSYSLLAFLAARQLNRRLRIKKGVR